MLIVSTLYGARSQKFHSPRHMCCDDVTIKVIWFDLSLFQSPSWFLLKPPASDTNSISIAPPPLHPSLSLPLFCISLTQSVSQRNISTDSCSDIQLSGRWFISPHTSSGCKLRRGVWEIERCPTWANKDSIIREVRLHIFYSIRVFCVGIVSLLLTGGVMCCF